MEVTNVRARLLVAMGVLLVGLLLLATQCPNSSSSLVAVFSASPTSGTSPLTVNFNASSSSGPDGSILVYAWSFGDGGTGTGETITHTYTNPGIYTAELTVTDDDGNMDSTSCTITVTAAVGTPPSARFTATPSSGEVPLAVNFNASASFDPDGSITSYAWSFGDGGTASGVTTTYTYTRAGTYTARLTVTDDDGSTDSVTRTIQVSSTPVANNSPTASFTASPTSGDAPLAVSFNASGSADSDGSITSYAWGFGDGGTASGVTASHTYSSAGTYTARLTVTDDDGVTDTTTTQIEVSASSVPEDLYVDANSGSDTAGDGTQANPYKTITKAVDMADAGGTAAYTIHVAAGIYNTALGEIFPLTLSAITLSGQGTAPDNVKIVGEIVVGNEGTVSNILSYSQISLVGLPSALRNCVIDNQGPSHGIFVYGGGEVEVQDCVIRRGDIFTMQSAGSINIVGNELHDDGLTAWGGDLHIEGNTFYSSWVVAWFQATAVIRANTFLEGGIGARGEAHVVIESNYIENNSYYIGIGIGDSAVADLGGGPLGSTGGNVVTGSAYWNMEDYRIAYSGSLYAKGNTWDDPQPSGTVNGPIDNPPNYKITNEGNSIIFSD